MKHISDGTFGRVVEVLNLEDNILYAMKVILFLSKRNNLLINSDCEGIWKIDWTFSSKIFCRKKKKIIFFLVGSW